MIRAAIPGCAGRMGQELVRAVAAANDVTLCAASEAPGSPVVGQDAGPVAGLAPLDVTVGTDLAAALGPGGADGVIDFTAPGATVELAGRCAAAGVALVVGTTGLGPAELDALRAAAAHIPLVAASNMSVGVTVLLRLVAEAARLLGPGFDAEVVEAHHGGKVDAPSGTALSLARALVEATPEQGEPADRLCHGRQGAVGPRPPGQVGLHAVRGGDIVGEHTVLLCGTGERLELVHRASSRQTFAQGALRALRWVVGRAPGLYDMQDVLGLRDRP